MGRTLQRRFNWANAIGPDTSSSGGLLPAVGQQQNRNVTIQQQRDLAASAGQPPPNVPACHLGVAHHVGHTSMPAAEPAEPSRSFSPGYDFDGGGGFDTDSDHGVSSAAEEGPQETGNAAEYSAEDVRKYLQQLTLQAAYTTVAWNERGVYCLALHGYEFESNGLLVRFLHSRHVISLHACMHE